MHMIFVPIKCPVCARYSVLSFARQELRRQLELPGVIELRCIYDDHCWKIGLRERIQWMKWLEESERSARCLFDMSREDAIRANPSQSIKTRFAPSKDSMKNLQNQNPGAILK